MSFSAYVSFLLPLAPDSLVGFSFFIFLSSLAHIIYLVLDSLVGFNFLISFSPLSHFIFNFVFKFGFNFCLAPDLFVGFKSGLVPSILASFSAILFISIWQYSSVCYDARNICYSDLSVTRFCRISFVGFRWVGKGWSLLLSMPRLSRTLLLPYRW